MEKDNEIDIMVKLLKILDDLSIQITNLAIILYNRETSKKERKTLCR